MPATEKSSPPDLVRWRVVYPVPSLCHTVGYTDPRFGASGLEAVYDSSLAGRDPRSVWASWLAELRGDRGQGADLLTTLDLRVQTAARGLWGGEPARWWFWMPPSGDVLALVSQPGFHDPADRPRAGQMISPGRMVLFSTGLAGALPARIVVQDRNGGGGAQRRPGRASPWTVRGKPPSVGGKSRTRDGRSWSGWTRPGLGRLVQCLLYPPGRASGRTMSWPTRPGLSALGRRRPST